MFQFEHKYTKHYKNADASPTSASEPTSRRCNVKVAIFQREVLHLLDVTLTSRTFLRFEVYEETRWIPTRKHYCWLYNYIADKQSLIVNFGKIFYGLIEFNKVNRSGYIVAVAKKTHETCDVAALAIYHQKFAKRLRNVGAAQTLENPIPRFVLAFSERAGHTRYDKLPENWTYTSIPTLSPLFIIINLA